MRIRCKQLRAQPGAPLCMSMPGTNATISFRAHARPSQAAAGAAISSRDGIGILNAWPAAALQCQEGETGRNAARMRDDDAWRERDKAAGKRQQNEMK